MSKQHKGLRACTAFLTVALTLAMTLVWVSPGFAQAAGWGRLKNMSKFMDKAQKNLQKQSDLRFKDFDDALWALESIAKMKGLGIISGYDGNVFRPNSAVKQAEALAMIARALGMEDRAQELAEEYEDTYSAFGYGHDDDDDELEFDLDDLEDVEDIEEMLEKLAEILERRSRKVEGKYLPYVSGNVKWALGYILLAVEEGWVKISEVNANASASRAWISMVMVRALGEDEAAQDAMDDVLPLKDFPAIPDSMVGYVAVAMELGLFKGYPDGKFQPNKAVSRAEMATIIDRYLTEELPVDTSYSVTGTIASLPTGKITVTTAANKSFTFTVSPDALILVGGEQVSYSTLKVGDTVEVIHNGEGVALLITVKAKTPATNTLTGIIVRKSTPATIKLELDDDTTKTISLSSGCKITYGTQTLKFADLRVGDTVRITLQNNVATAVKVTSREAETELVTGVIKSIKVTLQGTDIVIAKVYGEATYRLAEDVAITYRSASLDPEDLRTGDKIEATIMSQKVTAIRIIARNQSIEFGDVGGTITIITQSGSDYEVTVDDDGTARTFSVDANCSVSYGSAEFSRSGLKLGDVIRAELDDDGVAVEIRISARAS